MVLAGVKLFGMHSSSLSQNTSDESYSKKIVYSSSYEAAAVLFPSRLQLWYRSSTPGKERLVLDMQLIEQLTASLESYGRNPSHIVLEDVLVIVEDDLTDVVHLAVFTLAYTNNVSGKETISAWLHVIAIQLSNITDNDLQVQLQVQTSILVDEDIDLVIQPRLHSLSETTPSHRFYISWCNRSLRSVHVALIDGLNVAAQQNNSQANDKAAPAFLAEDTGLDADATLTTAMVRGFDAICIVKQGKHLISSLSISLDQLTPLHVDGTVYFALPDIQGHPFMRSSNADKSMRPMSLLLAIAIGELDHMYVPERFVRKMAESASLDDVLLQRVCRQALILSPSDSSSSTSSSSLHEAHPISFTGDDLSEKANRIRRIVIALEDWVSLCCLSSS
jgi:hypothetical protein